MHISLDEFEFNPIRPLTTELPEISMYNAVNTLAPSLLTDNCKGLDQFIIRPDPSMYCRVSCP